MPTWLLVFALATTDTADAARPVDAWFGADKAKHATFTFALQGGAYAALRGAAGHAPSAIGATVITLGLSVWKEHHDRHTTGFSVRDLVWDAAGIALASIVVGHTADR